MSVMSVLSQLKLQELMRKQQNAGPFNSPQEFMQKQQNMLGGAGPFNSPLYPPGYVTGSIAAGEVRLQYTTDPRVAGSWRLRIMFSQSPPGCSAEEFCIYDGPYPMTEVALLAHFASLTAAALEKE